MLGGWRSVAVFAISVSQYLMRVLRSQQEEQRQNHGYGEHFDGCQIGGDCGEMGEEVRRLRSTNR